MESLCRLCGSEDGIKVNIFETGSGRAHRINKVLPIMVNEHDPFPKQMCHRCSFKVEQFFEFRTISIRTQEMLRKKVPWLRDKELSQMKNTDPPMVQVSLNSVNGVSPNEKVFSPPNSIDFDMDEDNAILIEDSPTHEDSANTLPSDTDEQSNPTTVRKPKKSKSRSLWDTKKRKKRSRKPCRIEEVFSTNEQVYQSLNNIENDPLRLAPADNIEKNSFDHAVENNSCAANSPKSELNVVEKGILTDDRGGDNIALPKYVLTIKIPRVGNVYTCERCGITFLKPQPASLHKCRGNHAVVVEDESTLPSDTDEQSNPTKKRKRKSRKPCRILEDFSTDEQVYQNLNKIENDPLRLSPANNIEKNSFDHAVENNSCAANSPKSELNVVEKGILTDDRGGDNIALPKYVLTTKIPQVGNIYTCERCGITFLKPQPASLHKCQGNHTVVVKDERPKEDALQHHPEDAEENTAKDFYQCSDCGLVFTRHSQLISHQKKHNIQVESSSEDSLRVYNNQKKHHSRKKHKRRLLYTNNYNSKNSTFETTEPDFLKFKAVESNITRHSLLSSDSE